MATPQVKPNLDELNNVTVSLIASNDTLKWNGTAWVNSATSVPALHDIITSHTYTGGAALDVFGLSAANTIAKLTPSADVSAGENAVLKSASGVLTLNTLKLGNTSITTDVTAIRATGFGYPGGTPSNTYRVILIGGSSQQSISLGYDPSANPGSFFDGAGKEILFPDGAVFKIPNAGNTDYYDLLMMKSGVLSIGVPSTSSPAANTKLNVMGSTGLLINSALNLTIGSIANNNFGNYTLDNTYLNQYTFVGLLGLGSRTSAGGSNGIGVVGIGQGGYQYGVGGRFVGVSYDAASPGHGVLLKAVSVSSGNGYGCYIEAGAGAGTNWGMYQAGASDINYFSGSLGVGTTPSTKFHALLNDATTNAVGNVTTIGHDSTGTAANGFGAGLSWTLESSTTAAQSAALDTVLWIDATHASRTALKRDSVTGNATASLAKRGFWARSDLDNTSRTIILDEAGQDVASGITMLYQIKQQTSGDVQGGVITLINNSTALLYDDGTNQYTLTCGADGSLTGARTAGTVSFTLTISGVWF